MPPKAGYLPTFRDTYMYMQLQLKRQKGPILAKEFEKVSSLGVAESSRWAEPMLQFQAGSGAGISEILRGGEGHIHTSIFSRQVLWSKDASLLGRCWQREREGRRVGCSLGQVNTMGSITINRSARDINRRKPRPHPGKHQTNAHAQQTKINRTHKHTQICPNIHKHKRTYTNIHKHKQTYTSILKYSLHKHTQAYTNILKYTETYAGRRHNIGLVGGS